VRVIASGEAILAPSVTRRLLETMAGDSAAAGDGGQQIRDLLSAREVDVLLLVARGLSDAEIGAELHLAETTVKSHVQSTLGKLGVRDRLKGRGRRLRCRAGAAARVLTIAELHVGQSGHRARLGAESGRFRRERDAVARQCGLCVRVRPADRRSPWLPRWNAFLEGASRLLSPAARALFVLCV
jgi:hypothetical protein